MARGTGSRRRPADRRRLPAWRMVRPLIDAALVSLPERELDALLLQHLRGLPPAQVAAELGLADREAERVLTAGLRRLRARLAAAGVGLGLGQLASCLARHLAVPAPAGLARSIRAVCLGGAVPSPGVRRLVALAAAPSSLALTCLTAEMIRHEAGAGTPRRPARPRPPGG